MTDYPPIELEVKLAEQFLHEDLDDNHERNRNYLREEVIRELLKERAGLGNAELTSRYRYIVEKTKGGKVVFLTRPVPLNKGFDFVVHVEGETFSNGKDNPKHEDVITDLQAKVSSVSKEEKEDYKKLLLDLFEKVYLCVDPDQVIRGSKGSKFFTQEVPGLDLETLLKVIKWLFIEQDIRYWNWSGRKMLMNSLREKI